MRDEGLPWWLSWRRIRLQCGSPGFDPWVGKIPGEGRGYPLQYSGLETSMDCVVHGVAESDTPEQLALFKGMRAFPESCVKPLGEPRFRVSSPSFLTTKQEPDPDSEDMTAGQHRTDCLPPGPWET